MHFLIFLGVVFIYLNSIEINNIIYSIDKIRLKTKISFSLFSELEFRLKTIWQERIKEYYISPLQYSFHFNYVIQCGEDNTFWFGFLHNNEMKSQNDNVKYNLTVEFNPNKIKDDNILKYILNLAGEWYIKRFDVAMDVKVNILDIIYDMSGKRGSFICNNGYDNKTIYLGKGDGRIKIYNKKKESNLIIPYELTRVEITKELDDFNISNIKLFKYQGNMPTLYLNEYLYTFKDYEDKTLLALLYSVQNGFPLRDLSRVYKKKIKDLLQGGYKILFDDKGIYQALSKTIFYYFINNVKVHWL